MQLNIYLNMFTCNRCHQTKKISNFPKRKDIARGHSLFCISCKNAAQRNFQKSQKGKKIQAKADQARKVKFANKRSARSKTFTAIKNGTIKILPCLICGDVSEAHHPDYSRPLDVVWLCKIHHRETHLLTRGMECHNNIGTAVQQVNHAIQ